MSPRSELVDLVCAAFCISFTGVPQRARAAINSKSFRNVDVPPHPSCRLTVEICTTMVLINPLHSVASACVSRVFSRLVD